MPRTSYLIPNAIVVFRVLLAFVAVWLLGMAAPSAAATGVALIVVVVALDGVDGWAARRLDRASELGGVLDITADRIVEHLFWIAFAVAGVTPLWVPLVVMTRSFLVDAVRGMALVRGRTAFGSSTMMRSSLTRFLTASRFMRNAYGATKLAAFVLLGLVVTAATAGGAGAAAWSSLDGAGPALRGAADLAVLSAVALCVLRGVPVLMDGRAYLVGGESVR